LSFLNFFFKKQNLKRNKPTIPVAEGAALAARAFVQQQHARPVAAALAGRAAVHTSVVAVAAAAFSCITELVVVRKQDRLFRVHERAFGAQCCFLKTFRQ
jgi:hypothetical protein